MLQRFKWCHFATVILVLFCCASLACKKFTTSGTRAITNEDGSLAFSLLPGRLAQDKSLAYGLVECEGPGAVSLMNILEAQAMANYSATLWADDGRLLDELAHEITITPGKGAPALTVTKQCRLLRSAGKLAVMTPLAFAALFDKPSKPAEFTFNQTLWLAARGRYSISPGTFATSFYVFMREGHFKSTTNADARAANIRKQDAAFNPCAGGPRETFDCSRNPTTQGNYVAIKSGPGYETIRDQLAKGMASAKQAQLNPSRYFLDTFGMTYDPKAAYPKLAAGANLLGARSGTTALGLVPQGELNAAKEFYLSDDLCRYGLDGKILPVSEQNLSQCKEPEYPGFYMPTPSPGDVYAALQGDETSYSVVRDRPSQTQINDYISTASPAQTAQANSPSSVAQTNTNQAQPPTESAQEKWARYDGLCRNAKGGLQLMGTLSNESSWSCRCADGSTVGFASLNDECKVWTQKVASASGNVISATGNALSSAGSVAASGAGALGKGVINAGSAAVSGVSSWWSSMGNAWQRNVSDPWARFRNDPLGLNKVMNDMNDQSGSNPLEDSSSKALPYDY